MPDARCESRFIRAEDPRFPSCHSPTIVETLEGDLLVAWTAGKSPSAGSTSILTSRLRSGGWHLIAAAGAALGSYLLVLAVLRTEPVSYVVPLRSVSVLLSVGVGHHLLGEGVGLRRWAAAALILLGITAIALRG